MLIVLNFCFALAIPGAGLAPAQTPSGDGGRAAQVEFYRGGEVFAGPGPKGLRRAGVPRSIASVGREAKPRPARARALQPSLQLNQRVLVVYNADVPASLDVADYYMARRGIPQSQKCAISPPATEFVFWDEFDSTIKTPIRNCLNAVGREQILYVVFAYQTPFRLYDVPVGRAAEIRSVDQHIADIWDEYSSNNDILFTEHPYYAASQSQGNFYQPFVSLADYRARPGAKTIYSVWRLDAASDSLAKGLVDQALAAEAGGLSGRGCFDRNRGDMSGYFLDRGYLAGDWDIHRAAEIARQAGFAVTEDEQEAEFGTPPAPPRCDNAALYAGWYSLNNYNDAFTWNTGAVGFHLDSASALNPHGGTNWAANAIKRGITVTSGAVAEPYLEGLAHADGVFRNLFEGASVGDAFLRNTAYLKWMIINLGDPLYRPFPNGLAPFNSPNHMEASLALDPTFVYGGDSSVGRVTLSSPAPAGGAEVTLSSAFTSLAGTPASVTIPEGESAATFTITTNFVAGDNSVIIKASYAGITSSNTLVVGPRTEGYLDGANCEAIYGWAWDRQQPDAQVNVEIYDGGSLLATVPASNFRQDLLDAGAGNGQHGFTYPTPASLKDAQPHSIHARVAGTDFDVYESPKIVTCSPPPPPPTPNPAGTNVALASNGARAIASSTYGVAYPASAVIDGDRRAANWSAGGWWNDATANSYPDTLEVDFSGAQTISEIDFFTLQDNYTNPVEPTDSQTFTQYGVTAFDVQYFDGSNWQTVPGGVVTRNEQVKRRFTFAPVTTAKIRIVINGALADYSRVVEVEAYAGGATPPNSAPSVALTSPASAAAFTPPANITVSADASDADGVVRRVDFYAGAQLIGSATSTPYAITWGNVASGTYSLTAVATDDDGATTTSPAVNILVNRPPDASAGGPYGAATGKAIQFRGGGSSDSDGAISSYRWSFGDGTTGAGVAPMHAYVSAGTYTVTLTVTDDAGASASATTTASITSPPPAAPTSLKILGKGAITLYWADNSTNELGFEIERSTSAATGFVRVATAGPNSTKYADKTVQRRRTYYYRVRAVNAAGASAYTNTVSVRAG